MKKLTLILILLVFSVVAYSQGAGTAASIYRTTYAKLLTQTSGSVRYCTDCQATAPCTNGGTGAFAYKVGSAWNCNTGAGGGGGGTTINATDGVLPQRSSASAFTDSPITGSVPGSMVNGLTVTGGATTVAPIISATGSDTNIGLKLLPKGTGAVVIDKPSANTDWLSMTYSGSGGEFAKLGFNNTGYGLFSGAVVGGYNGFAVGATPIIFSSALWKVSTSSADFITGSNASNTVPVMNINSVGLTTKPGISIDLTAVQTANPLQVKDSTTATVFAVVPSGAIQVGGTDTGLARNAAGVVEVNNGTAGTFAALKASYVQQTATRCFLAADQTNATATMANMNNCSVTLTSGRKYTFRAVLYLNDSTAVDGAQIDFNGGAATMTNFRVHCTAFDTALGLSSQGTALSTAYSASTFTGAGMFECYGTVEPSSTNTFIPRFAQVSHSVGTPTLARGSHLLFEDMP